MIGDKQVVVMRKKPVFVVAGNHKEALDWAHRDLAKRWNSGETSVSLSEYILVSNIDQLRGHHDPHGVFIGTWRSRRDILNLIELMIRQTMSANANLMAIHRSLRPTPKLKPVSGGWINEELISQQLMKVYGNVDGQSKRSDI
jgi:hypothetical protein